MIDDLNHQQQPAADVARRPPSHTDTATPDAPTPPRPAAPLMAITGWRLWRVDPTGILYPYGTALHTMWEFNTTVAGCLRYPVDAYLGRHQPPEIGCRCGLYAHKYRPAFAELHVRYTTTVIVGLGSLWGRVIEHERGWRAQYGRLLAIVDPANRVSPRYNAATYPTIDAMLAEWGCEVECEPEDAARRDIGDVLAGGEMGIIREQADRLALDPPGPSEASEPPRAEAPPEAGGGVSAAAAAEPDTPTPGPERTRAPGQR